MRNLVDIVVLWCWNMTDNVKEKHTNLSVNGFLDNALKQINWRMCLINNKFHRDFRLRNFNWVTKSLWRFVQGEAELQSKIQLIWPWCYHKLIQKYFREISALCKAISEDQIPVFAFNTKLPEMAMMASENFTFYSSNVKLPPAGINRMITAYPCELTWNVLVRGSLNWLLFMQHFTLWTRT